MNPHKNAMNTNDHDVERLKRTLLANGESPEETESLAKAAYFLRQLPTPEAHVLTQQHLLDKLVVHLPQRKGRLERLREWYPVAVLLSQLHILQTGIWPASAIVMLLGTLIMLKSPNTFLLTVLAPIVAAVGVSMIYDHEAMQMLELESSTRASGSLLLLARLTLVFGFDLILALLASFVLALLRTDALLWQIISSWLVPMTFLSALSFFLSIWLADTFAAGVFSLSLWVAHLIFSSIKDAPQIIQILSWKGLTDPTYRPLVFSGAALLVIAALLKVGRNDYSTKPE
jgi:hypothetical protein